MHIDRHSWTFARTCAEARGSLLLLFNGSSPEASGQNKDDLYVDEIVMPLASVAAKILLTNTRFDDSSFGGFGLVLRRCLERAGQDYELKADVGSAPESRRFWKNKERSPTNRGEFLFFLNNHTGLLREVLRRASGFGIAKDMRSTLGARHLALVRNWLKGDDASCISEYGARSLIFMAPPSRMKSILESMDSLLADTSPIDASTDSAARAEAEVFLATHPDSVFPSLAQ